MEYLINSALFKQQIIKLKSEVRKKVFLPFLDEAIDTIC